LKKKQTDPKRGLFFYYAIVLCAILLFNVVIMPLINSQKVVETDYSTFLTMLQEQKIDKVQEESGILYFSPKDENDKHVYMTGAMNDPDLVNRLTEAGVSFGTVAPKQYSPLQNFLLSWLIPGLILFLLGNLLLRSMQKKMGGNAMSFGKSKAKIYISAETGKTFDDVAGQDEAKEALTEIVDFLHNPDRYRKIGAKMPKGALLVGPPGTGKTLLAKAVAGEAGVPFFSISGSEFVEMFVGMGAANVRDLFKQAREKAPCIVFIDEIDTIGKKRDGAGFSGNDEREQTLNQLLTEMDGFDGSSGVVILAATNRPETLDKALLRPGRFDRRIPVELPDLAGREAILQVHAKNIQADPSIDYNAIARATAGASGAELANIINEGALHAVRDGRSRVLQGDLEEAVETVIAGYQRKGAVISLKERRIIAYHEIGHALVSALQKHSAPVHKITIVPRTSGALGYTMQVAEEESVLMSKEEALDKITTFTGGRAAEALIFHSITSGASNDIEQATRIARAMVTRLGMSDKFGMVALETVNNQYLGGDTSLMCSQDTASQVDEEVLTIIQQCYQKAYNILQENKGKLHELAAYLLEKETITGEEFMEILNQPAKLPQPSIEVLPKSPSQE
jgi:cell division protease FtsH